MIEILLAYSSTHLILFFVHNIIMTYRVTLGQRDLPASLAHRDQQAHQVPMAHRDQLPLAY